MQSNKNNNNRFRKLIPTNSREKRSSIQQIYSSSLKPFSVSQSKMQKSNHAQHSSNFASLQKQSGEELKLLRQRQLLQRRLKTISSAAYQGSKQKSQFSDHNLKRKKERLSTDEIDLGKRSKLNSIMELITEFKIRTDWIFNSQKLEEIENQNRMNILAGQDQNIYQEQVYQIVKTTQQSSTKLLAISINRILSSVKSEIFEYLKAQQKQVSESSQIVQLHQQTENYLISNIEGIIHENQVKDNKRLKTRRNMLDVNKFFEKK